MLDGSTGCSVDWEKAWIGPAAESRTVSMSMGDGMNGFVLSLVGKSR